MNTEDTLFFTFAFLSIIGLEINLRDNNIYSVILFIIPMLAFGIITIYKLWRKK